MSVYGYPTVPIVPTETKKSGGSAGVVVGIFALLIAIAGVVVGVLALLKNNSSSSSSSQIVKYSVLNTIDNTDRKYYYLLDYNKTTQKINVKTGKSLLTDATITDSSKTFTEPVNLQINSNSPTDITTTVQMVIFIEIGSSFDDNISKLVGTTFNIAVSKQNDRAITYNLNILNKSNKQIKMGGFVNGQSLLVSVNKDGAYALPTSQTNTQSDIYSFTFSYSESDFINLNVFQNSL